MEKESVFVALVVEKEPSAIVIEDPKLLAILDPKLLDVLDLSNLHVIPKSYREQIETLINELVEGLDKRGVPFGEYGDDIIQAEDEKGTYQYFMTTKMYEEFYVLFEDHKDKYDQLRDELTAKYDQIVSDFLGLYKDAIGDKAMLKLKSIIPSKEQFNSKFKLKLNKMSNSSLEDEWVNKFTGKSLQNAFSIARYLDKFKTEEMTVEAIDVLSRAIEIINETNISSDKVVEEIVNCLKKIQNYSSVGSSLGENPQFYLKKVKQSAVKLAVELDVLDMIEL
jgi:hypothetical protein